MRAMRNGLGWLTLVLALAGCHSYEPHLRPPKMPEQYKAPPDEARYQRPPIYPAEAMNKGSGKPSSDPSMAGGSGSPMSGLGGKPPGR